MGMPYTRIAMDLVHSLCQLLVAVSDDPILFAALSREHARLIDCLYSQLPARIARHLDGLWRSEAFWAAFSAPRRPKLAPLRMRRVAAFFRLRAACYSALSAGLLGCQRFDALMLLGQRAVRSHASIHASSSSISAPGSPAAGDSPAGGGSTGPAGSPAAGSARGLCSGCPSRTKRSSASTICACA